MQLIFMYVKYRLNTLDIIIYHILRFFIRRFEIGFSAYRHIHIRVLLKL